MVTSFNFLKLLLFLTCAVYVCSSQEAIEDQPNIESNVMVDAVVRETRQGKGTPKDNSTSTGDKPKPPKPSKDKTTTTTHAPTEAAVTEVQTTIGNSDQQTSKKPDDSDESSRNESMPTMPTTEGNDGPIPTAANNEDQEKQNVTIKPQPAETTTKNSDGDDKTNKSVSVIPGGGGLTKNPGPRPGPSPGPGPSKDSSATSGNLFVCYGKGEACCRKKRHDSKWAVPLPLLQLVNFILTILLSIVLIVINLKIKGKLAKTVIKETEEVRERCCEIMDAAMVASAPLKLLRSFNIALKEDDAKEKAKDSEGEAGGAPTTPSTPA